MVKNLLFIQLIIRQLADCELIEKQQEEREMIKVKCLTGPHAEVVREMPEGINPSELFMSMMGHGWRWEVDYSEATREEATFWMSREVVARAFRAISEGRLVLFMGTTYRVLTELQDFEDAVVASGFMVTIKRDDDYCLELVAGESELA